MLEAGLGGRARVIAEGLGGRTTAFDDWSAAADRNGATVLPTLLSSHTPFDLVIQFLGTNDLKPFRQWQRARRGPRHAAAGRDREDASLCVRGGAVPKIVIVSPPHVVDTTHAELQPMFEGGIAGSKALAGHYARAAADSGVHHFDAATVATATPVDGVHLDAKNTRAIGEGLVPLVKRVLGL